MTQVKSLTRRQFIEGTAATGLALGLAGSPYFEAQASEPRRGGRLNIGLGHGNTTDGYDPATWDNGFNQCLSHAMNSYLTGISPDGSLNAEIAESWEASDDATSWIFTLRSGVEFHDGRTVTADDVVASLNYHRGEESKSAAKPIVDPIAEIRTDGPDKVIVTLEAGNADFPLVLSDYHLPILPSMEGKAEIGSIGCGPYVIEGFEPGVRAGLRRHPNYWRNDAAYFDGAQILAILDAAARQNALVTGEVDVVDSVDLNTVQLLQRAPGIEVLSVSGTQHYTFAMDTRTEPFNDNNVRLALKHAIDRQELVDKILNGYGVLGNDHPIGRANRYHASDLEQREYDPEKARFHLKQAGLESLEVTLSAADAAFEGAVDAGVLYAEKAAAAGISINVIQEPNDGYWSNVWMKKPWSAVYWSGRPTEDWMFSTAYSSGAAWNDTYWNHERFNDLLLTARSELDEVKRREMYVEMQRIVRDEGGVVIPMFASYVSAYSEKVAHPQDVAANWALDGWRLIERWWFA